MDWFLYDIGLRRERVKNYVLLFLENPCFSIVLKLEKVCKCFVQDHGLKKFMFLKELYFLSFVLVGSRLSNSTSVDKKRKFLKKWCILILVTGTVR